MPYSSSLKTTYEYWIDKGIILTDTAQKEAINLCCLLQDQINKFYSRKFLSFGKEYPKGLYLYGKVGRGKSMIMDLFFDTTNLKQKRRVHFNNFMNEIHVSLKQWRDNNIDNKTDPLPLIAKEISKNIKLLCFDEFQVTDITDAMILSRLFTSLFKYGVIVVATSNVAPINLYKDGLQRENFLPFIAILQKYVIEYELKSPQDYRLSHFQKLNNLYIYPYNYETSILLNNSFADLTNNALSKATILEVNGRSITIPHSHGDIAMANFSQLCAITLGSADYITIANNFSTIILHEIPIFNDDNADQGKRFISLIDQLYEHKVKLICSAQEEPIKLCQSPRLSFEFQRTASRLNEMQSKEYLSLSHNISKISS